MFVQVTAKNVGGVFLRHSVECLALSVPVSVKVTVTGHLYSALLLDEAIATVLRYGPL